MRFTTKAIDALIAGVLLAAVPGAGAATLDSTWVHAGVGEILRCRVANVGKTSVTVEARLLDASGTNVADVQLAPCDGSTPLPPNGFCYATVVGPETARCSVTSSSSRIRAALTLEAGATELLFAPATTK